MGVLVDYFAADEGEITNVSGAGVAAGLAKVEAKGFGVVPFGLLAKRLLGRDAGVEPGPPLLHGDGYAWFVQRITPAMASALSCLGDADIAAHAEALAGTEDLAWPPELARKVFTELRELARGATRGGRALYLWCSV